MSDSDDDVSHVFDQTNGVIAAADGEADGALSGRTTAEVGDPTGSTVAARPPADAGGRDREDDRDVAAASPGAGAAAVEAEDDGTGRVDDLPDRREDGRGSRDDDLGSAGRSAHPAEDPTAEEHRYAVDGGGTATDEGPVPAGSTTADADSGSSSGDAPATSYSDAPAVAAWSAADDGRDEGSTRAESSTRPVDDASHTGRLADAYATGPAAEADRGRVEAGREPVADPGATADAGPSRATGADADGTADRSGGAVSTQQEDRTDSLAALAGDDDSVGHVFDQTNGVIDGASGESDGTADGDSASRADRDV